MNNNEIPDELWVSNNPNTILKDLTVHEYDVSSNRPCVKYVRADKAAPVERIENIKWAMDIAVCERQNLERQYPDLFDALPILNEVADEYLKLQGGE